MKSKEFLNSLAALIAQDKLQQVIHELQLLFKDSNKLNEVILQSARYNDVMKQIRLGTISYEDSNITKNQIRVALIDMIAIFEDEVSENNVIASEIEKAIKGSDFTMEGLKAKKNIDVKVKLENSKTKIKDIESEGGKINIDIEQK